MNKTIAEVVDSVRGGATPPRVIDRYWNGTIPWVTVKDLVGDKVSISETVECITEEGVRSCSTNVVPANGLIVCTRIAVGKAVVPTVPMAINQDLKWLVLKPDCDTFYTAYQFQHAQERIHGIAIGSTVRGISLRELRGLSFHFPDPTTQRTIARILGTLDGLIERTEALIAKQQQIKQGLLHDLFTRGVDAQGRLRPPHSEAPELYHETALGWLPKGWRVERTEELADILDHMRVPVNSEERAGREALVPYYGANGLQGYIDRALFNEPLILLAEDGGNFDDYETRPIAYRIDGPSWVNNHAHILRPRSVDFSFMFFSLEHKDIRKYITGGTRSKLTKSELQCIEYPVAGASEQTTIGSILNTQQAHLGELQRELIKYIELKTGLMQDLLTGRVSVEALAVASPSQLNG